MLTKTGTPHLDGLAVDELIKLLFQIEGLIEKKLETDKASLKARLAFVEAYEARVKASDDAARRVRSSDPARKKKRPKPAPKFRDPITGNTWAGRGRQPRWMAEAIKSGARQEDFVIAPHDYCTTQLHNSLKPLA